MNKEKRTSPRHPLCRLALIIMLCLTASSLCTACFVTARNTDEVTVGGGITF